MIERVGRVGATMTPEEIETLIREQSDAYKKASRKFGVGPVEKATIGEAGEDIKRGIKRGATIDGRNISRYENDDTDEGSGRDKSVRRARASSEDLRGGYGGAKAYGKSEKGLA